MLLVVAATEPELVGASTVAGAEVLACGIGPVDAAVNTARRLAMSPEVSAVLHVGIAGCRRGAGIEPGALVLGSEARYCDTASRLVEQHVAPDAGLLARARAALPEAHVLPIGTAADVGGSRRAAGDRALDVEAMEGFAVLRAARLAGVPALELRAVSNEIEEPDRARWRFDLALDELAACLPRLASSLAAVAT